MLLPLKPQNCQNQKRFWEPAMIGGSERFGDVVVGSPRPRPNCADANRRSKSRAEMYLARNFLA